jgi:hypothetical protein
MREAIEFLCGSRRFSRAAALDSFSLRAQHRLHTNEIETRFGSLMVRAVWR